MPDGSAASRMAIGKGYTDMMRTKLRRVATVSLAAVLSVGSLTALSGCAIPEKVQDAIPALKSPERVIEEDLKSELDTVSDPDSDLFKDFVKGMEAQSTESFDKLGLDSNEFGKAYLADFKYDISSVKVDTDNGTATAYVTVKSKQMNAILSEYADAFNAQASDLVSKSNGDEDALYKSVGQLLLQCTKDSKPIETMCKFKYTKKGNVWEIESSDATKQLTDALMGSTDSNNASQNASDAQNGGESNGGDTNTDNAENAATDAQNASQGQ